MQELLTSLPAAVAYLSGPDLIIDFANEACFRLIGDRDLLGRPLDQAFPELADRMDILHQIMKTGEPVHGSEATVRLSHLRAEPLRNATEWLAGYREFWAESFDRLDELLATLQDDPKGAHHGRDDDDR